MRSTSATISSNHRRGNSATTDNTGRRSSQLSRISTLGRAPSAADGKCRINGTILPSNAHRHTQPGLGDGPQTPADMANKHPGRRQEEDKGHSTGRKGDQPNGRSAGQNVPATTALRIISREGRRAGQTRRPNSGNGCGDHSSYINAGEGSTTSMDTSMAGGKHTRRELGTAAGRGNAGFIHPKITYATKKECETTR